MIEPRFKESLDRYVQSGCPTGGFLEAVLKNDLMEAMGRADIDARYNLFDICVYVHNDMPAVSQGSPEKVDAWLAKHAEARAKAAAESKDGPT